MTLLRSGDNLHSGIVDFIAHSETVEIYAPFITVNILDEILADTVCNQIVVRWKFGDILQEACDFEKLYEFCKNRNIALYRNTQMHLKVLVNERKQILFGSANVTNRGMGLTNYNFELSGSFEQIEFEDEIYLSKIVDQAEYISEEVYENILARVRMLRKEYKKPPSIPEEKFSKNTNKAFLMSSLPMSHSPLLLWLIYSDSNRSKFTQEEVSCAVHDITLFKIPENLDEVLFIAHLSKCFNDQKFIRSLKRAIIDQDRGSMGYSMIANWLAENTETVPTPRRWDIRDSRFVNILYTWICHFDTSFVTDRPNGGSTWLIYQNDISNDGVRSSFEVSVLEILNTHVDARNDAPAPYKFILFLVIISHFELQNPKTNQIKVDKDFKSLFNLMLKNYDLSAYTQPPDLSKLLKSLCRDAIILIPGIDCSTRLDNNRLNRDSIDIISDFRIRPDFWHQLKNKDMRGQFNSRITSMLQVKQRE
jgi:hypothetical protein